MKIRSLILPAVLLATVASFTPAFAQSADMQNRGDQKEWSHKGSCHQHPQFSAEQKQLLHKTMKAAFEKNKAARANLHQLHEQLHDIVKADTFDAAAFKQVSGQIEQTKDQMYNVRMDAFASIAGQFTPAEREAIMHRHHKWHRHGKHHHHHSHRGQDGKGWEGGEHQNGNHQNGDHQNWDHGATNENGASSNAPVVGTDQGSPSARDNAYPPYSNR